jgi:hypothetical protein
MKYEILNIIENSIKMSNGRTVMHIWEDDIMKKKSDFVCKDGGDIIEFGFGMGISASYIQKNNINSHTICEINPQILEILYEWKKDKDNVIVVEGDWFENKDKLKTYDGILFDTHNDSNSSYFFKELIYNISKKNTKLTWWNNKPQSYFRHQPINTQYEKIEVNPPENDYFNHKEYFIPKYVFI